MQRGVHDNGGDVDDIPEPANLRFLRRMVTLLMVTMIVGIAVIAAALVIGIAGEGGDKPYTDIAIPPDYEVRETEYGAEKLMIVLRHRETGAEVVRIYGMDGVAPGDVKLIEGE